MPPAMAPAASARCEAFILPIFFTLILQGYAGPRSARSPASAYQRRFGNLDDCPHFVQTAGSGRVQCHVAVITDVYYLTYVIGWYVAGISHAEYVRVIL